MRSFFFLTKVEIKFQRFRAKIINESYWYLMERLILDAE